MTQQNYQRELDNILNGLDTSAKPQSLLLHACCAPCSSYVLTYLARYFNITISYYNPNISPDAEFYRRRDELETMLSKMELPRPVRLIAESYDPEEFFTAVKGLEQEPEGGRRCEACFRLRLKHTAESAKALDIDWFCSTLTISPHKNAALINTISADLAADFGVRHLPSDFKKRGGYQQSLALSRQYGLYRQDYCGCAFSMRPTK